MGAGKCKCAAHLSTQVWSGLVWSGLVQQLSSAHHSAACPSSAPPPSPPPWLPYHVSVALVPSLPHHAASCCSRRQLLRRVSDAAQTSAAPLRGLPRVSNYDSEFDTEATVSPSTWRRSTPQSGSLSSGSSCRRMASTSTVCHLLNSHNCHPRSNSCSSHYPHLSSCPI